MIKKLFDELVAVKCYDFVASYDGCEVKFEIVVKKDEYEIWFDISCLNIKEFFFGGLVKDIENMDEIEFKVWISDIFELEKLK